MSVKVDLPWGDGELTVEMPDEWRLLGELKPSEHKEPADIADACRDALSNPINAQRLSERNLENAHVVIVSDDHSRPTPVSEFINPVLEELYSAGVNDDDIDIIIATGTHRPSRLDEVEKKLGFEIAGRIRWRNHDAYKPGELAYLGETSLGTSVYVNRLLTEADLIICLGAIEPHLLLGFGGGLKMLIPGCAGQETIGRNHMQGVDSYHFDLVGISSDKSPMRLDLEEGARLVGGDIFIVNAVMNEKARPTAFFCGDPVDAHREGIKYIDKMVRFAVPEQADVVLTNSFPMNNDLRQSIKCVGNTLYASKPGGLMMGMVKCDQGLGEMPLREKTLPYPVMRGITRTLGPRGILPFVKMIKKGEPIEELFIGHFGLQMLRRNNLAIFSDSEKLPDNVGRKLGLARSFNMISDMITWASSKAPKDASVWVFPYGGSTYAYFEG